MTVLRIVGRLKGMTMGDPQCEVCACLCLCLRGGCEVFWYMEIYVYMYTICYRNACFHNVAPEGQLFVF